MELRLNLILVATEFIIYKLDLKTVYCKAMVTINASSVVGNLNKWKI